MKYVHFSVLALFASGTLALAQEPPPKFTIRSVSPPTAKAGEALDVTVTPPKPANARYTVGVTMDGVTCPYNKWVDENTVRVSVPKDFAGGTSHNIRIVTVWEGISEPGEP